MIEQVKGKRINLRRIRRSDASLMTRFANDRGVARNTFIPYPYALADAYAFMRRDNKGWRKGTEYSYAIADPVTDEYMGGIGIMMVAPRHQCVEIGYWLGREHRGKGIVPEAVRLILRVAFRELKAMRVQAEVLDGNESSVRVLEKCGFTYEGTLRKRIKNRGRWRDAMMFSILKAEWRKA